MISRFANPQRFLSLTDWLLPLLSVLAVLVSAIGVVWSLGFAPADYQQGETARIMYIHVPSAWIAVGAYSGMAIGSLSYLVWGHTLGDIAAKAIAPIGAAFTALCLATGSIWGRPTWGTWWEWDGRLTSVLVLFFLYLGYMALRNALEDPGQDISKAAKAAAILCLVGTINIPIIRFSVEWWNTLHQKASIIRAGGPSLDPSLLHPLLVMGLAYLLIFTALSLAAIRAELWARSADTLAARIQA
ncbi:heme ABC transporter permease [Candidatus Phycosocius spiralis]|uniref:Heme exporter protein C n=1 Tax=Candidatus Phycosocius spiralis TaxID=2815099 RepID=A0ABQ4PTJ1_9PROT|nr:heme ABC transporter permease [Candidatus Phycosocius spiralis]GIU66332.1 cytochrome C biogenesis protein CcmC [Candidatus Phycosocius spiralis]